MPTSGDKATVLRWIKIYKEGSEIPPPLVKEWEPKCPQIRWPSMEQEVVVDPNTWAISNFPHRDVPPSVSGVVNIDVWNEKINHLQSLNQPPLGLIKIMKEVSEQLTSGAFSMVQHPGTVRTHCPNFFSEPSVEIPRVVDALASFVSKGHMAGPLFFVDENRLKINSLMAIKKPGGHVRVVANLKSPKGSSFNDGILDGCKNIWPVTMTVTKDFAKMIVEAGQGAFMACSDMKDAYKMIPVCMPQRELQAYKFCGGIFIETKMVFGDKMACLYFDRLHFCILKAFVYPTAPIHIGAQGRTVDDNPVVVPACSKQHLVNFVKTYRESLSSLGIEAADNDPTCTKAFDCSTNGEVLGIRFDTVNFTWNIPHGKLYLLVQQTRSLACANYHSLRELEVVVGKLRFVVHLCPPLRRFLSSSIRVMKHCISMLGPSGSDIPSKERDERRFCPTEEMRIDLLMFAAILVDSYEHPLPIMDPDPVAPLNAVPVYTDASGSIGGPTFPSLGVFFSPCDGMHAAAFSIPFTTDFLLQNNGGSLIADTTSTLEALGLLIPFAIHPSRLAGKAVHVRIDNQAVVWAFKKKRSDDRLTETIIRAADLVSGAMGSRLFVSWEPRRSSRSTIIADDLTHINFSSCLEYDPRAFTMVYEDFPPPISKWMEGAAYTRSLGHSVIEWMKAEYTNMIDLFVNVV